MTTKGSIRNLELKERRILRKILGPVKVQEGYRRRHNQELYEHIEDITTCMRKRKRTFYGHLERMDHQRLTFRVHQTISQRPSYAKWTKQVKKDLSEAKIDIAIIHNRDTFRKLVRTTSSLEPLTLVTSRPACKWTQERRETHIARMKAYWSRRKAHES